MRKVPGVQQSLSLQFCSLLCVRHFDAHAGKYKIKSSSCGLEIYWDSRCFRSRGTHTPTISIMLQIICIHTELHGRETNESNCGAEHINGRRTEFM